MFERQRDEHAALLDFRESFKKLVASVFWRSHEVVFDQHYKIGYDLMRNKMNEGPVNVAPNIRSYLLDIFRTIKHLEKEWKDIEREAHHHDSEMVGYLLGRIIGMAEYGLSAKNYPYFSDDAKTAIKASTKQLSNTKLPSFGKIALHFPKSRHRLNQMAADLPADQKELIYNLADCLPE